MLSEFSKLHAGVSSVSKAFATPTRLQVDDFGTAGLNAIYHLARPFGPDVASKAKQANYLCVIICRDLQEPLHIQYLGHRRLRNPKIFHLETLVISYYSDMGHWLGCGGCDSKL